MIIYVFWQVTQGRKELIVLLKQQIVNVSLYWVYFVSKMYKLPWVRSKKSFFKFNFLLFFFKQEGKDKSYLLDKLQNLQTSQPNKTNKLMNQKKVWCKNYLMQTNAFRL